MHSSISLLRALVAVFIFPRLAACEDETASPTAKAERPVQVERVAVRERKCSTGICRCGAGAI